jgi:hypothetical protein
MQGPTNVKFTTKFIATHSIEADDLESKLQIPSLYTPHINKSFNGYYSSSPCTCQKRASNILQCSTDSQQSLRSYLSYTIQTAFKMTKEYWKTYFAVTVIQTETK